ncbi:Aspartic proteinase nepenthesin-1 [Acorus calamus]|uniref:Aspartic proteinase nepenthesin-1 n=1 Tax=Acorus calamus TaxID=4465 RepID=A0AAV9EKJ2_ACOCL|nr:Aspartic proteinase nepenthesin-1 [Acorus calamus]
MAFAHTVPLTLTLLLPLLLLLSSTNADETKSPKGFRVVLIRVDSGSNLTKLELLRRAVARGNQGVARLITNSTVDVKAPVHLDSHSDMGVFLMELAIGTPKVPFSAIVSTGSDIIITQCKPCKNCLNESTPIFDPSISSSYSNVSCQSQLCLALSSPESNTTSCEYSLSTTKNATVQGVFGSETFSFDDGVSVPGIGFACWPQDFDDFDMDGLGVVGLGRGALSLVSQLGLTKFSYCFTSYTDPNTTTSPLMLGSLAKLKDGEAGASTPLIKNELYPSLYYVSLKGISVGGTRLQIPESTFALNKNGTGGLFIDSGTPVTYLEEVGYDLVSKAIVEQVKLPVVNGTAATGLDLLCFPLTNSSNNVVSMPELVFHFEGGADLVLPEENIFYTDTELGVSCLTMMKSTGGSVLGNYMQQNLHVVYDLEKDLLSFAPAKCSQL